MNPIKSILIILIFALHSYASIASDLGMRTKDYNNDMALVGLFIGFIFMFFTIYLSVQIGGKK